MIKNKKPHPSDSKDPMSFKDDELSPKGKMLHQIEPEWPIKNPVKGSKKRKIHKTETAKLP